MSTQTQASYRALVGDALDLLFEVLRPYVEREMRTVYGDRWMREAREVLHNKPPDRWDTSDMLSLVYAKFFQVFSDLGHEGRSWVSLLKEIRKRWAHQGNLSLYETRHALETTVSLLHAIGAYKEVGRLEPYVTNLMRQELQERLGTATGDNNNLPLPHVDRPDQEDEADDAGPEAGLLGKGLRKVRHLLQQKAPDEPLELRRDLLDAVERAAEPHKKHFTFNRLVVHILAENDKARLLYESALEAPGEPFRESVLRRLADARIPIRGSLSVGWKIHRTLPRRLAGSFEGSPYYIELRKRKAYTSATLTVVQGRAKRDQYTIKSGTTVTLGRLAEVIDEKGRRIRRNTVAFQDYEDERLSEEQQQIHKTISRVHASIRYDDADAVFRLYDDQSTWGTSVVREDYQMPIPVKQHPVPLQDGDLIYVGKACLRFKMGRRR